MILPPLIVVNFSSELLAASREYESAALCFRTFGPTTVYSFDITATSIGQFSGFSGQQKDRDSPQGYPRPHPNKCRGQDNT